MMFRRNCQKMVICFLLLWTAVDLAVPALCRGESQTSSDQPAAFTTALSGLENSPQSNLGHECDCFCCCSHLVPGTHFESAVSLREASAEPRPLIERPDWFQPRFHLPPRS